MAHWRNRVVERWIEALRKERKAVCDYEFENYLVYRAEEKRLRKKNRSLLIMVIVAYLFMMAALLCSTYLQYIQDQKIKELEAKYQEAVEQINTLESERNVECPQ